MRPRSTEKVLLYPERPVSAGLYNYVMPSSHVTTVIVPVVEQSITRQIASALSTTHYIAVVQREVCQAEAAPTLGYLLFL